MTRRQRERASTRLRWDRLLVSVTSLLLALTLGAVETYGSCGSATVTGFWSIESTDGGASWDFHKNELHTMTDWNRDCDKYTIRRSFITATIPLGSTQVKLTLTAKGGPSGTVGVYAVSGTSPGGTVATWGALLPNPLSNSGSVTFAVSPTSTTLAVGLRMVNEVTSCEMKQHIDWETPQITVTACGCTTLPTINCPGPVTVPCAAGVPAHDFAGGTASSNCGGAVTVTWESDVISGKTCDNRYTITRTYKATDGWGNFKTCTQTITVNDTTAPTATQGTILACYATADAANQAALDATTSLTDNCGTAGLTKVVHTGAGSCDTSIVIRVSDQCGNSTDYTYATRVDNTAR